jgi:hypothetical protein
MLTTQGTEVLDDAPDFFVSQLLTKSNHGGTDRPVLDDPEDFTFRAMAPKSVVLEITGRWIQLGGQWPITTPRLAPRYRRPHPYELWTYYFRCLCPTDCGWPTTPVGALAPSGQR